MAGSETQSNCPRCATANRVGARFCRNCGARIGDDGRTSPSTTISTAKLNFDRAKWDALALYDKEVSSFADQVRPLGPKWMDELASAYMALGNNAYLPDIVAKIKARADVERKEQEEQEELLRREKEQKRIEAAELQRVRREQSERAKAEEQARLENARIGMQRAKEESEARREQILEFLSFNKWPLGLASLVVLAAVVGTSFYYSNSKETVSTPAATRAATKVAIQSVAPSFDCSAKLSWAANQICLQQDLAGLDRSMAASYRQRLGEIRADLRPILRFNQRVWLTKREECASKPNPNKCLQDLYRNRIDMLSWPSGSGAFNSAIEVYAWDIAKVQPAHAIPNLTLLLGLDSDLANRLLNSRPASSAWWFSKPSNYIASEN